MPFTSDDRNLLRDLARRVADVASNPVMDARRKMWFDHNALRSTYPLMLVFPEGGWLEILPPAALHCSTDHARLIELELRKRLHTFDHFRADNVIENKWIVEKSIHSTGWGLEMRRSHSEDTRGAYGFDPVIKEPSDLKKLRHPIITHDESASAQALADMQDLFGDILDVQLKGTQHVSFHLMCEYTGLRGLEEVMVDMYAEPQMLHDAMAFLEEGHRGIVRQMTEQNLLDFNNDNTYQGTGGNGFTHELPRKDANPHHARPQDMWAGAEAQEMAQVSPQHHAEFILPYEKRLLEPFALTAYGCCDDLTNKLDSVFSIPGIRRISICPWADVDKCAQQLKGNYIFSWKPKPMFLVGQFNPQAIREYVRHTLEVCRASGCVLEMILKDTHTCENHPERFDQWSQIAREEILSIAGQPPLPTQLPADFATSRPA
jgi:hypothetical protein